MQPMRTHTLGETVVPRATRKNIESGKKVLTPQHKRMLRHLPVKVVFIVILRGRGQLRLNCPCQMFNAKLAMVLECTTPKKM